MLSISTPHAPAAIGPYSQAMVHGGLVYCSGQIALIPSTGALVEGDVAAQTQQVLANLDAVLMAAGSSRKNVLKTTVFLRDMADFKAMNDVYTAYFGEHRPARATVAVAGLPRDVRVEIDCIATVA
ncbi:MAG TPA: RidA family protein [Myxococcota bacterium]|nr:RidA family protein [Myxococcota bacterium]HND29641.1 RidA family protein [Myxococcota bacterium]